MSADGRRFDALRRSQIQVQLNRVESELLITDGRGRPRVRAGSTRDRQLRTERAELLAALQRKDEALLVQWREGRIYGGPGPSR